MIQRIPPRSVLLGGNLKAVQGNGPDVLGVRGVIM